MRIRISATTSSFLPCTKFHLERVSSLVGMFLPDRKRLAWVQSEDVCSSDLLMNLNRGNADQDIRHNFVFSSLYEIPFGKGKQFGGDVPTAVNYVIGGWQWNNIVTLQTGTPMDLIYQNDSPNNRPRSEEHTS